MIPSLKLSQFRIWYTLESGLPLKSADFLENISSFQIRELLMIFFLNHFSNWDSKFPLLLSPVQGKEEKKKKKKAKFYLYIFFLNKN